MAKIQAVPVGVEGVEPRVLSPKLRAQLNYFIGDRSTSAEPALGENEFWFDPDEVEKWLDDGVIYLVSPLDTANKTEVELSEEQEDFLGWLKSTGVTRVKVME